MFRAQASLLKAALRQAGELEAALGNEQHQRRQETARLRADNEILRNALAVLNAEALNRRQVVEAPLARDPFSREPFSRDPFSRTVPEQRDHASPILRASSEQSQPQVWTLPPEAADRRGSRGRSGREAGPA